MQGDLIKSTADAIVHPTNATYYMGGQVGEYSKVPNKSYDTIRAISLSFFVSLLYLVWN